MERQGVATMTWVEVDAADVPGGQKIRLGALPDGRRVDWFVGKGGVFLRVRESQGAKRFFRLVGFSG